jgi:hypothetical protein
MEREREGEEILLQNRFSLRLEHTLKDQDTLDIAGTKEVDTVVYLLHARTVVSQTQPLLSYIHARNNITMGL